MGTPLPRVHRWSVAWLAEHPVTELVVVVESGLLAVDEHAER